MCMPYFDKCDLVIAYGNADIVSCVLLLFDMKNFYSVHLCNLDIYKNQDL